MPLHLVVYLCRLSAVAEGKGPKILAQQESSDEEEDEEELTPEELGMSSLLLGHCTEAGAERQTGSSCGALGDCKGQECSDAPFPQALGKQSRFPFPGEKLRQKVAFCMGPPSEVELWGLRSQWVGCPGPVLLSPRMPGAILWFGEREREGA